MKNTRHYLFTHRHFRNIVRTIDRRIGQNRICMKVLIVDDNQEIRQLVRACLPKSVEKIVECEDGEAAFESYIEHQPDWVLMDWEMPNVDGITATRRIIAEFPKAHICMVTAFDNEDLKGEALAAGASEFVLKDNLHELKGILVSELKD